MTRYCTCATIASLASGISCLHVAGLETVPIPPELSKLNALSSQLIQCAKCYQTVIRLGTYTAEVPVYSSLKACKGTMFFLPSPLSKTLETLDQVERCSNGAFSLPDPELYVIVMENQ